MPISFNYVPSGIRVPLFYAEVDSSAASTTVGTNKTALFGQMTDGAATVGEPVVVSSASKAKTLFGRGSQLARMVEAYRLNDPSGVLYAVPLAEPSGAKATGKIEINGEATAAGVVYLYIAGTRVSTSVAVGDGGNAVAVGLAAAINAAADLPVVANVLSGESTVSLTAKNIGELGNSIPVALNFAGVASGEALPEGISATVTAMAGGAGSPDVSAVFAALGDEAFEFVGMPYSDSTALDAAKTVMNDASGRWSPIKQLYGHVYCVRRGELSDLVAFGKARNDQHATIFALETAAPADEASVIGAITGRQAQFISADPARPTQTGILYGIAAPKLSDRFGLEDRQALLTSGIATLYVGGGYTRIERAITTCQKNAFGDDDVSYLDSETLHTLSYVIRYLRSIITTKYARHKLADDGTRFGAGQAVVTPSVIKSELISAYRRLEYQAIVENADKFAEALIVERDTNDVNRMNVLFAPDLVNQLRIFALLAQFRLQYDNTATEE